MTQGSFAQRLAIRGALPHLSVPAGDTIAIGFMAPLTGPVQSWGLPGLNGCEIWVDHLNRLGGFSIGGRRHRVRIVPYDCQYSADRAMAGAQDLVRTHDIKLLLTLGGDTLAPVLDYLTDRKLLTATLLPSDLSPDTPYLIAPSETHPVYNVTGIEWLRRSHPELRRIALCSQTDALGLPSLATYRAACGAAGLQVVREIRYDPASRDAAGMVAAMMEDRPDILCWCTSYTPMVHALTEAAFASGFQGQIVSCTLDSYAQLIARTSRDFMEGFLFQFPDFDDPALTEKGFFFDRPSAFFADYNRRFPDSWSAVSWEYAATLDIWRRAVERAGSVASPSVLAAMKHSGTVIHAFGAAEWWGTDLFGIDNALVGDWPVVRIRDGRARIVAFGSIPDWLSRHGDRLRAQMVDLGQMWDQRQVGGGAGTALSTRSL